MKKMLFLSLLMVLPTVALGGVSNCGETHVSFDGIQGPDHDEFLYTTSRAFDAAAKYKGNDSVNLGTAGLVYECDNDHCPDGYEITLPAGHVFKGDVQNKSIKYKCRAKMSVNFSPVRLFGGLTDLDDMWIPVNESGCFVKGETIAVGSKSRIVATPTDCNQIDSAYDKNGVQFQVACIDINGTATPKCYPVSCKVGYRVNNNSCVQKCQQYVGQEKTECLACMDVKDADWDEEIKKCICQDKAKTFDINTKVCKILDTNKCESQCATLSGAKQSECIACCHVTSAVAKWENGSCLCTEHGALFAPNQDPKTGGVCHGTGYLPSCAELKKFEKLTDEQEKECNACRKTSKDVATYNLNALRCVCKDPSKKFIFDRNDTDKGGTCHGTTPVPPEQPTPPDAPVVDPTIELTATINNAVANLDKISGDFDISKWKNADGKFNTTRLASDSIAGVVLGTAGGLITSKVIKKNQIKNGFDAVRCVIGGQNVAEWGDEFTVGTKH